MSVTNTDSIRVRSGDDFYITIKTLFGKREAHLVAKINTAENGLSDITIKAVK